MKSSTNNEIEVIREKLKSLRTKKCHMIFDNLGPDQKDIIYLSELVHLNSCKFNDQGKTPSILTPRKLRCITKFFQSILYADQ